MTLHPTRSSAPMAICHAPMGLPRRVTSSVATALLALAATLGAGAVQAETCTATTIVRAAQDGDPAANGSSWAEATTLQAALGQANGNTTREQCFEIRVKQGVYKPTTTPDRSISFAISRPLQLKGGYTGNSDTDRVLNARNTVLSGDIDNNDEGTSTNGGITAVARFNSTGSATAGNQLIGNNSLQVLTIGGLGNTSAGGPYTAAASDASYTLVEGVTITGGRANSSGGSVGTSGAGLFCNGRGTSSICSPSISNSTFSGNSASYFGGAIDNDGYSGTSNPIISNSTFSGNSASSGGAIFNDGRNYGISSPSISNSTFSGNSARNSGGAVYNSGSSGTSSPSISNSTFSSNSASYEGGAVFNDGIFGTSNPSISNSTFSGNSARLGGAVYNSADYGTSSPNISNSTFSGNSASNYGGALYSHDESGNSSPSISNSTFNGNSAFGGGAVYHSARSGTSSPSISNSTFSGNLASRGGGAVFIDGDFGSLSITASILWGNTAPSDPQIYHLATARTIVTASVVQGGWRGTDILDADPQLGPLQDNGGPTLTMLPGTGSSAIDAVVCTDPVATDQRGVARPQGAKCDMGAVELVSLAVTVTAVSPASSATLGGTTVTISGTNFTDATSATVCGAALDSMAVVNATTITGTTPAHPATTTACDVVVTTPLENGTGATLFSYSKSSQSLNFGPPAPALVVGGAAGTVSATSSEASLDALTTFSSLTTGICTVTGTSVSAVAAGTCTVAADNPGNADFNAATQATLPVTIGKASQAISGFTAAPATPVFATDISFTVAATGGASGNAITFTSSSLSVCTVAGNTVNVVSAGNCALAANQTGNGNYNAAPQVTLDVTIAKASQTLAFATASPTSHTLAPGTSFAINPLATSDQVDAGYPITYSSLTPAVCAVSGAQVTMLAGGTCTVAANQAGDTNHLAAAQQTQDVTLAAQTSFGGTTVPGAGGTAGPASASFTGGGASCRFDNANTSFVAAPATLPAGQTMPQGMLRFTLVGCDTSVVTMSVTWPQAVQGLTKFGKATSAADPLSHFAPNGLTVSGNTTTFTVQDGQKGDDDWAVNGVIVDPVGPTVAVANVQPVPTLGQWALVLLSLLAAGLGMGILRRSQAAKY